MNNDKNIKMKKIEEVVESLTTGLNPRKNFVLNSAGSSCHYITGKDISDGRINVSERTDKITIDEVALINKRAKLQDDVILFASTGTGTVGRMAYVKTYDGTWNVSETLYIIKLKTTILPKFFMNYIESEAAKKQYEPKISKGSVPHLKISDLMNVVIPIPTLDEQRKIIEVLDRLRDTTNNMIESLEEEYSLRDKQFEHYREKLFDFSEDISCKELGELFPYIRNGFVGTVTPYFTDADNGVRYLEGTNIHNGVISDNEILYVTKEFHQKYIRNELKQDDILMVQSGHIGECAVVGEQYAGANCHALIIMSNGGECLSKYVCHYFHSIKGFKSLSPAITGGTVRHVLASKVKGIKIPVPPIDEQKRIVDILDKYEDANNSLCEGIREEVKANRQRYNYYRDKLFELTEE